MRHHESEQACMALIADWRNRRTVHDHARDLRLGERGLSERFEVDEATLSIRLRPARGSSGRRRTINVTIALPNGCNLKSKTEKERLICNKYLPRWGLVKEV
ncbi:MAG: hypothetical protein HQM00_15710 [Magnetococcales bacterium]|nr:hypothetical protein [Magnetococcales bacterium]